MQPIKIIDLLNIPIHEEKPAFWKERTEKADEVNLLGAYVKMEFTDEKGCLNTILQDFSKFAKVCGFSGNSYPIIIRQGKTSGYESFILSVSKEQTVLTAEDTEGIRRGLIFLEDEMQRHGGAFLPLGKIIRTPHVKTRISRSFFAPATHYGEGEELSDDVDYYPDEYLNRLAHDGVNGLWVFVHFKTLLPSKIVPEYGMDCERRLNKLNGIIEKCAKYGIKVYALGTEPASTHQNPDILNHEDMLGASFWGGGGRAVCPSTEKGRAYIEEAMTELFTRVPNLAGFISISVGESVANCGGVATSDEISCPHCKKCGLTKPGALAKYEKIMAGAMKKVKPDAEFISWGYGHRGWTEDMICEYAQNRCDEAILMENFEDRGEEVQLGKPRTAIDYWLSYTGPGKVMENAVGNSKRGSVYAKLQVCNSHEIATLPYIPAPGKLYDKYKYMHEKGISGAVYCWYFGNYPSLMNKAAGELAYWDFNKSKEEFLKYLASLYWGDKAEKAALAWGKIEEGYSLFPVNVAFTWYGVITDSVARDLYLLPKDIPLSQNWLLGDEAGDRIGECLALGHTIDEAITLCDMMYEKINEGADILEGISCGKNEEQINVAKALTLLSVSGVNILRFYKLRNVLGMGNISALSEITDIVCKETENTKKMIALCKKDARLGYHSEAEGYKFNSDILEKRLENLEYIFKSEVKEVEKRIGQSKCPLAFFEEGNVYYTETNINASLWDSFEEGTGKIRIAQDAEKYVIELNAEAPIQIRAEFETFMPYPPVLIDENGKVDFISANLCMPEGTEKTELSKWHIKKTGKVLEVTLYKADFDIKNMRLLVLGENSAWKKSKTPYSRLIWGSYNPAGFVWIKNKKGEKL